MFPQRLRSFWLAFCDCGFCSGGCGIVVLASSVCPLMDEDKSFPMGGTGCGINDIEHFSYFLDLIIISHWSIVGFPWWLSGEESACQSRRRGFSHWVEKIPWRRKCNPLQYSCLGNPLVRGARRAAVHGPQRAGRDRVSEQQ